MKKYEYVTVEAKGGFIMFKFPENREIIDEYALKGFRYVGFIPVESGTSGMSKMDLIFEQDV